MTTFVFANNASSTLATTQISPSATALTMASNTGQRFPPLSANQQYTLTFTDAATGLLTEIAYVTAQTGDNVTTMIRGQENTTAMTWNQGDLLNNYFTAGTAAAFQQTATLQPIRQVTTSGSFALSTADANGTVGLNRTSSPGVSSTTLPALTQAQFVRIQDLAKNFNKYPVTISYPAGQQGPEGATSQVLSVNGQTSRFDYYGGNQWGFDAGT